MTPPVTIPPDLPQRADQTTAEHPWPLRYLSANIREYVARMSRMWVEGEITEFVRRPDNRVQFFTLADLDEKMTITCKAFTNILPGDLDVGQKVIVNIKPDFWPGSGSLSLQVYEVRHVGAGDLLARIEELRRKLGQEGLFAAERKKPLPFLPRRIGLICGANAKAKDDVLVNARLRWPDADFEIREVKVQGPESAAQVRAALAELDGVDDIDVIVIARGGGSVEDLLPFSDEPLVRAVAAARTPVVTAIGHEGDRPIIDDVADYRASTPTDAARRIVPDVAEERKIVVELARRGRIAASRRLDIAHNDLDSVRSRPVIANPLTLIEERVADLTLMWRRLGDVTRGRLDRAGAEIDGLARQVASLSPQSVLKRGYAIVRTKDEIIRGADQVGPGDRLEVLLGSGRLGVEVHATREDTDD